MCIYNIVIDTANAGTVLGRVDKINIYLDYFILFTFFVRVPVQYRVGNILATRAPGRVFHTGRGVAVSKI